MEPIGFMQGRLSALVDGKIQAFPAQAWRAEFAQAAQLGLALMEWTLDQTGLRDNPLMTPVGRAEIAALRVSHGIAIPSVTGDCFMQAPFWKVSGAGRAGRQQDFLDVVDACGACSIGLLVVPLVDAGSLTSPADEDRLVQWLLDQAGHFERQHVRVLFESDFGPSELARLMDRLPMTFGINYDIGNSAALGFDPVEEFGAYGNRVLNVHVKDRPRNGTTVALGRGDADFAAVFAALARADYAGNYILQTARAEDGDHAGVLARYRDLTTTWIRNARRDGQGRRARAGSEA